jgi:LL-diaminopimelate aminotransferase
MVKKLVLDKADRVYHLPPEFDDFLPKKDRKTVLGHDVLDLARFRWPCRLPDESVCEGGRTASDLEIAGLAEKTAEWYRRRFGVRIHPGKEIFIGGGIRSIMSLLSLTYFNPGDMVLIPDPGVWHFRAAVAVASAEPIPYHLSERNRFKPTVNMISTSVARLAKGMILNSPHNPTGAVLTRDDLAEILHRAGKENLLLILDQAFEGFLDGENPASLFSLPGGRKVGLEMYSYAYNFGRPVPSFGFAVGQAALIAGLKRLARVFGHGISRWQVNAGLSACDTPTTDMEDIKNQCAGHRKLVDQLCQKLRLGPADARIGPFYWAKLPGRKQSRRFCRLLYLKGAILAMPGVAFGEGGEGYVRFSLTAPTETYEQALEATRKLFQAARGERSRDG